MEKSNALVFCFVFEMVPAFDKVCFAKDSMIGDVLGPVKTKFGWHLIYIEDRKFPEPVQSKKEQ